MWIPKINESVHTKNIAYRNSDIFLNYYLLILVSQTNIKYSNFFN